MNLFENAAYRLTLAQHGRRIDVGALLSLALLSGLDTTDGADETLAVAEPAVDGATIVVERRWTLWRRAWLELRCLDTAIEVHTCVQGRGTLTFAELAWEAAALILTLDVDDPYTGLRRHRDDLVKRAFAPPPLDRLQPEWWHRPIFCGWGAQCHLAQTRGGLARDYATQERYDAFLERLEANGVVPGTVVIDDKWQATYGRNEPDTAKWPDLRRWIAARHEHGQHVLLWWKAWDAEGLPPEASVRNRDGLPVGVDPNNPQTRETLAAAKDAKPHALLLTHTPHPSFAWLTDIIRLNDVVGGQEIAAQMKFRAGVVRAVCPELPIDTDDWRAPDKQSWRAFLDVKSAIGVPSLYYASHLDATGEELDADDYAAVRRVWAAAAAGAA